MLFSKGKARTSVLVKYWDVQSNQTSTKTKLKNCGDTKKFILKLLFKQENEGEGVIL
jgi:hypothetical protein